MEYERQKSARKRRRTCAGAEVRLLIMQISLRFPLTYRCARLKG